MVIWSVGGNCEKTGNCNSHIICLRENAQSPSLVLKYNEQRVENSSLRPVLEKEGVEREKKSVAAFPVLEDTGVVPVPLAGNRVDSNSETFGDTSVASHSINPIF